MYLSSVCSIGSRYKFLCVCLKIVIIKREVEVLVLLLPVESWGSLAIHSEQDATIRIRPRSWGDYSCNKILTIELLYCVTCLLYELDPIVLYLVPLLAAIILGVKDGSGSYLHIPWRKSTDS